MEQMLLQPVEHTCFQHVSTDCETIGARATIASIGAAVMAGADECVAPTALTATDQA
jgi:hypothetical protein